MSTGIQADSTLSEFYNNEFKKESNKGRYIILKISDDKKFIQLEKSSEDPTFESYLADLTQTGEPRFSVLKFKYESNDGRPCEKLISITWLNLLNFFISICYEIFDNYMIVHRKMRLFRIISVFV